MRLKTLLLTGLFQIVMSATVGRTRLLGMDHGSLKPLKGDTTHKYHTNGAEMFNNSFREGSCENVEIVSREEWRARPAVRFWAMKLPLHHVIIQHTVSPTCHTKPQCIRNVQFIQDYHLDYKGWSDIAYNFLIGGDGRVYEGIGWKESGAHSINFNTNSAGIAFIGNYNEVVPNQKMVNAALNLIKCGVKKGFLTPTREIHGHRDVACTQSPGDKLYAIIRQWYNYKGGRLSDFDCSGY